MPKLGVLEELERLKAASHKINGNYRIQPNLQEQTNLVAKNVARKFINNIIRLKCQTIIYKLSTGDFRRNEVMSTNSYYRRVSTSTINDDDGSAITEQSDKSLKHSINSTTTIHQDFVNAITNSKSFKRSGFDFTEIFERKVEEESKNPRMVFNNFCNYLIGCKMFKISRDGRAVEVKFGNVPFETKQLEDSALHNIGRYSSPKSKRLGLALLLDPCLNTHGVPIRLKITYIQTGVNNPEIIPDIEKTKEVEISSDGNYFGMPLTSYDTYEVESYKNISVPGWGGVRPIFISSKSCKCALVELGDSPLVSLSLIAFPATSASKAFTKLSECMRTFCIHKAANFITFGGLPAINLAALHGNYDVSNIFNIFHA